MKTGRNDKCPCGSGKKFKQCCINKPLVTDEELEAFYQADMARGQANLRQYEAEQRGEKPPPVPAWATAQPSMRATLLFASVLGMSLDNRH